jgi:hypothetical protein
MTPPTRDTADRPTTDDGAEAGADTTVPSVRWPLLSIGGVASLCCLFATPAATGVGGAAVAGGATAAAGGGVVRVLVSALTLGLVAAVLRYRAGSSGCQE